MLKIISSFYIWMLNWTMGEVLEIYILFCLLFWNFFIISCNWLLSLIYTQFVLFLLIQFLFLLSLLRIFCDFFILVNTKFRWSYCFFYQYGFIKFIQVSVGWANFIFIYSWVLIRIKNCVIHRSICILFIKFKQILFSSTTLRWLLCSFSNNLFQYLSV